MNTTPKKHKVKLTLDQIAGILISCKNQIATLHDILERSPELYDELGEALAIQEDIVAIMHGRVTENATWEE